MNHKPYTPNPKTYAQNSQPYTPTHTLSPKPRNRCQTIGETLLVKIENKRIYEEGSFEYTQENHRTEVPTLNPSNSLIPNP